MKFRLILLLALARSTILASPAGSQPTCPPRRLAHTTAVGGLDEVLTWKPSEGNANPFSFSPPRSRPVAGPDDSARPAAAVSIWENIAKILSRLPYSIHSTQTPMTSFPQAEQHIAVDPFNAANLVAAVSDFAPIPGSPVFFNNTTKYAVSLDYGANWFESYVPLANGLRDTADGRSWQANSDPVVAVDRLGNVFLSSLYFDRNTRANGIYVCAASLPSVAFAASGCQPVVAHPDAGTPFLEDKQWIAVDQSNSPHSGNLYAAWTHYDFRSDSEFGTDWIQFSRSTDRGRTWSPPMRLSPLSQDGVGLSGVQGAQVAVGPDGAVFVVYGWGGNQCGGFSTCQHFITKSTDGGASFDAVRPLTLPFNDLSFDAGYRFNSFPAVAVSPADGVLYDVYADQPGASSQIEVVRSDDATAAAFTMSSAIDDSAAGQRFMPAAAVDAKGVLHVSWYDTRFDPAVNDRYDVFAAFSRDGGSNFSIPARLTTDSIDAAGVSFIGDYSGIASSFDGTAILAHPVWTDGSLVSDRSLPQPSTGRLRTATLAYPYRP
jgi:hypothetical protein